MCMTRLDQPSKKLVHTGIAARSQAPTLLPGLALGCGMLAIAGAVWLYWLIIPGALFGIAAVSLGVRLHRSGDRSVGSAAIALGIAALFLVPSVLYVAVQAENWGRDCALNLVNPDC